MLSAESFTQSTKYYSYIHLDWLQFLVTKYLFF